jgi:hypothetical protein
VGRNVCDNVIQRLLKNKIRVFVTHHQDFLRQSDLVIKIKGKKFQSLIPRENNLELEELDVEKKDKLPSPQDGPRNVEITNSISDQFPADSKSKIVNNSIFRYLMNIGYLGNVVFLLIPNLACIVLLILADSWLKVWTGLESKH